LAISNDGFLFGSQIAEIVSGTAAPEPASLYRLLREFGVACFLMIASLIGCSPSVIYA
jgi:hypothetical protein